MYSNITGIREENNDGKSSSLDLKRLKDWASSSLPCGSYLRELILSEANTLSRESFLAKLPVWLKLFDLEFKEDELKWEKKIRL
jgi:hypothetical protein